MSKTSHEAFDYLLRFEEQDGANTNLYEPLGGMKAYRNGKAPKWVVDMVGKMDQAKRNALECLKDIHGHIKFVPGVAASGKSTFLLTLVMLMSHVLRRM